MSLGFEAFAAGMNHRDVQARLAEAHPDFWSMPGDDRMRIGFREMFARIRLRPMLADLDRLLPAWRPQRLIHDTGELAGASPPTSAGIAHAEHSSAFDGRPTSSSLHRGTRSVVRERGLEDPGINGNRGETYLDICPPSLQEARALTVRTSCRCVRPPTSSKPMPRFPPGRTGSARDLAYMSRSARSATTPLHVFRAVLDGVADEDVDVILTIGPEGDPSALGPVADNVHVERFLPQGAVLRRRRSRSRTRVLARCSARLPPASRCSLCRRPPTSS